MFSIVLAAVILV